MRKKTRQWRRGQRSNRSANCESGKKKPQWRSPDADTRASPSPLGTAVTEWSRLPPKAEVAIEPFRTRARELIFFNHDNV
jgi:hypothetical protein